PLPQLEAMVAAHLRRPRVHVLTVRLQTYPYDRPALTTAGRYLVGGTAADEAGQTLTYAFFVKVVQAWLRSPLSAAVPEPLRSELAPLMPWRTEPDIYRGELGRHLPDGLSLPHAYHVTDLDDESAAVWLDRVPVRQVEWDVARHRRAAYLLGRLASSTSVKPFAAHVPIGRTARRFAEHWLAVNVVPDLTSEDLWRQPNVAATFDAHLRRRILRAAAALPALVDELESLPATTAHGDACTDNLLHTRLSNDIVLIDFGFWGTAPVGFDLGQLLLGEIQLGRRPARAFPELEEACLPAYVQGLRDEGCTTPVHQVRRAHAIAMTIFHAIPSIPYEHRTAEAGPDLLPLFANRAAMAGFILDLLDATQGERP
ncbi:phosphotransferase, partial [Actinoplanes sp. NPDC051633]|uniref:phosphotransferase n=1 Tax=Actinoplanes sp. NPDC051633 TaxID=3155670 RepID=UPI003417CCD7